MPVDHIRYDLLTQQALRGVVRTVLTDIAKNGLPGEHHFFVTFDTRMAGVRLSQRMRAQYPEEMTIVLQHQFWDLSVGEEAFEVGLSFGGVPEKLVIPFEAVNRFRDPSVQFELQFAVIEEEAAEGANAAPKPTPAPKGEAEPAGPARRPAAAPAAAHPAQAERPAEPPEQTGEVVSLDRFRKK